MALLDYPFRVISIFYFLHLLEDIVQTVNVDIAIVGAGGGGLRAAIAAAEANPNLKIALVSKVYPMRSHTVAAEGGAAAVIKEEDS